MKIAMFLVLLAGVLPVRAGDTDCAKSESGVAKLEWRYPMPERTKFPPLSQVATIGAFVALDERVYAGTDDIFHVIVMVGTRPAIDEFQSIAVDTGFDEYAEILARVLGPDGKAVDMTAADISCQVQSQQLAGYSIGKSSAPKHYVLNVRGLAPGSILQYQVAKRLHRDTGWIINWNWLYSNNHSLRRGSQSELAYWPWENPFAMKSRYPAANVQYTYAIPLGMDFHYKILNDNGKVKVVDTPKPQPDLERVVRFVYSRPALVSEPYEPYLRAQDPEVITWVVSTQKNNMTPYKIYPKDWQEYVTQDLPDHVAMFEAKGGIAAARAVAGCHDGLAVIERIRCLNRHLRDRVALASGNEVRTAFGFRPPKFVIDTGRVATQTEKALTLIAAAREWGTKAALVLARPSRYAPIDRAFPTGDWFEDRLVAVQVDGRWEYFYPGGPYVGGSYPDYLDGAEALLVENRKTWEWIRLPGGAATAGGTALDFSVEAVDAESSRGALVARWTGSEAAWLRQLMRDEAPQDAQRYLSDEVEAGLFQGVNLDGVTVANLADPDQPLELRARFTFSGALVSLGASRRLRWLPGRSGPRASEFAASTRTRPIDFLSSLRYETVVRIPAALAAGAEPPAASEKTLSGFHYALSAERGESGLTLRRILEVSGVTPVAAYPEVRKFMIEAEQSDLVPLAVAAAK